MVKLVGEGKTGLALAAIRRLLWAGERPEALVGLLARQIRLIWLARIYKEDGSPPAEIASRLGVAPYFVGEYVEAARRIAPARLAELHRTLATMDLGMKSGRVAPDLALELFALAAAADNQ